MVRFTPESVQEFTVQTSAFSVKFVTPGVPFVNPLYTACCPPTSPALGGPGTAAGTAIYNLCSNSSPRYIQFGVRLYF